MPCVTSVRCSIAGRAGRTATSLRNHAALRQVGSGDRSTAHGLRVDQLVPRNAAGWTTIKPSSVDRGSHPAATRRQRAQSPPGDLAHAGEVVVDIDQRSCSRSRAVKSTSAVYPDAPRGACEPCGDRADNGKDGYAFFLMVVLVMLPFLIGGVLIIVFRDRLTGRSRRIARSTPISGRGRVRRLEGKHGSRLPRFDEAWVPAACCSSASAGSSPA